MRYFDFLWDIGDFGGNDLKWHQNLVVAILMIVLWGLGTAVVLGLGVAGLTVLNFILPGDERPAYEDIDCSARGCY